MVWCLIESRRKTSEHRGKDLILSVLRYCLSYSSHNRMVAKNHYQKKKDYICLWAFFWVKMHETFFFWRTVRQWYKQWNNSAQLNLFDKVWYTYISTWKPDSILQLLVDLALIPRTKMYCKLFHSQNISFALLLSLRF